MSLIKRFVREERGATAIEYGLIAGLVAVAVARHERLQYQQVGVQVSPRSVDGESE